MWYSAVGSIVTLLLSLLTVPLAAAAQPPSKIYRIGFLSTAPPPAHAWAALLDGLRERGYSEGQNLVFERRFSEGHAERFPAFAAEMVRLRVDLVLAITTPAALAVKTHQRWLSAAERDLLGSLPRTLETSDVTLCHGSLRDPLWEYVTNPRSAAASLALAKTAHCCAGHTHVPSLFSAGERGQPGRVKYDTPYPLRARVFMNPGSVGQPRDGDPRAAYAILDGAAGTVTFHRSPYRIEETQRRIRERGLPPILADRLSFGL
jgi:diadenosine tetraphosphatase ApaH/serine/threonine PP2A family protein phosphatase